MTLRKDEPLSDLSDPGAVAADTPAAATGQQDQKEPPLKLSTSRQFPHWLREQKGSLVFTTYQAGKVFLIGTKPDYSLSIFERTLSRCMGMTATETGLYISTLFQLWHFENVLGKGEAYQDFDRLFTPRRAWVTGDMDIHDLAVDADGRPIFVNTLFSCLSTVSDTASFSPIWRPPFITKLAAEDRCHMNGLAMRGGRPAFVSAVARSDVADGWRDHRESGGIVMEVPSGEIVASGLSMPHSPRYYRDTLYVLNSGTGEFGKVDLDAGKFEPIAFCPGYLRGLTFLGDFAIITLSLPRKDGTFGGLPLDAKLEQAGSGARCGLWVVDLRSGDAVHWFRMEGIVSELYDVVALPGVERPAAVGFKTDEIRRVLSVGEEQPLGV